ncbi:MAG TPA: universal stress protein [Gammaproteobacteria bacterium]|nr:universal stress protein [Gammaproteobacteria bacterium]
MSIKIILVPIGGNKESMTALKRALVLANRFGAHIKGLHVMQRVSDAVSFEFHMPAKLRGSVQASAEQSALAQADEARAGFEAVCREANVALSDTPIEGDSPSANWHQEFGHVEETLIRHARLSDVVAVPRPVIHAGSSRRSPVGRAIEAMLFGTGRPVLIEPPMAQVEQCERVAIGWNESTEASRAIAMTWPWLVNMGAVTILSSKKREAGANALMEYLSWHRIAANVVFLDSKGDSVGEAMLNVCTEAKTGLLVVGGFSHARARELLFGGVTRHLLTHSNIPTLMVH